MTDVVAYYEYWDNIRKGINALYAAHKIDEKKFALCRKFIEDNRILFNSNIDEFLQKVETELAPQLGYTTDELATIGVDNEHGLEVVEAERITEEAKILPFDPGRRRK
ncbi:MAG: hypothetical protein WC752_00775 [Patescibacteria group bacterium]|jgi:hypothetical protein